MSKRKRILYFLIVTLIGTATLFLAVRLLPSPPAYVRFVSAPLPDGTRVTFLRPFGLNMVQQPAPSEVGQFIVRMFPQDSFGNRLWYQTSRWLPIVPSPYLPPNAKFAIFDRALEVGDRTAVRVNNTSFRETNLDFRAQVVDRRQKRTFVIAYGLLGIRGKSFPNDMKAGQVAFDTFRVLQPGEEVPQP